MDENTDIAFLAASVEREMKNNLAGSSGLRHNRTDFRKFLSPQQLQQGNPQQYPQQQYPPQQYNSQHYPPPQQQYPPQQYSQPQYPQNAGPPPSEGYVPEGVLPQANVSLIPLPPGYQQAYPQSANTNTQPLVQPVDRFDMPDYSKNKSFLADEKEFRDALIKEVKSQKKNINKLNREVESLIVLVSELVSMLKPKTDSIISPKIESQPEMMNDSTD